MKHFFERWTGGWFYLATATVLAYAAIAAAVAGTAVTVSAQQQQARTTKAVSQYNSKLQENQTIQDDMESQENQHRAQIANQARLSSQRAAISGSNVTEAGSPLEVLAYSAGQAELQRQDAARAAEAKREYGISESQQTLLGGASQSQAYNTQSYGTILSGVSSVAGSYNNAQYTGAIPR